MKRRHVVTGLALGLGLLGGCLTVALLAGIVEWFRLAPAQPPVVRIAPVAPLASPPPEPTAPPPPSLPGAAAAPTATPALQAPAGEAPPAPLVIPTTPRQPGMPPTNEPSAPANLPPGSVNRAMPDRLATRLVIPRLGVDAPVTLAMMHNQAWQVDHLGHHTVGHLEGTAPPGASSNMVLAGHLTLAGGVPGPFKDLASLEPGDVIRVYRGAEQFEYAVGAVETVEPTTMEVTYPTSEARLTLITCDAWNEAAGRYELRRVVTGSLIEN